MATATWYLTVDPLQEPTDVGPAEDGRQQYSFNVLARKRPSVTFLEELLGVLELAGVGAVEVDLFGSSATAIPTGDGPYLVLRETGGTAPKGTHNDGPAAYRCPAAQVLVIARTTAAARTMAHAAYDALIAVSNRYVEPRDLGASA
jgi:hypothetical protein